MMRQVDVISRQLEAYNAHDLEGFCSWYSDDAELRNMGETEPFIHSKDMLRETYGKKFLNTALAVKIANRIVKGNYVIDHEKVEGIAEKIVEVVVIYEVVDDLIRRVSFIRG